MNEEKYTAAGLLSEWKRIKEEGADVVEFIAKFGVESLVAYRAALKRREIALDQMCDEAGLHANPDGTLRTPCDIKEMEISEFVALVEWLKIRKAMEDGR